MNFSSDLSAPQGDIESYLNDLDLDRDGLIRHAAELLSDLHVRLMVAERRIAANEARDNEILENLLQSPEVVSRLVSTCGKTVKKVYVASRREDLLELGSFVDLDAIQQAGVEGYKRSFAVENRAKQLANDPKQAAKREVAARWVEWYGEKPHLYSGNDEFAIDMLKRFGGVLESHSKIKQWCSEWSKAVVLSLWAGWKMNGEGSKTLDEFIEDVLRNSRKFKKHVVVRWCKEWQAGKLDERAMLFLGSVAQKMYHDRTGILLGLDGVEIVDCNTSG